MMWRRLLWMSCITLAAQTVLAATPCASLTFSGVSEWAATRQPRSLEFANINRDAWPDLVVAGADQNREPVGGLTVLAGNGGSSWRADAELVPDESIPTFAALDYDGDGDDDVVYLQDVNGRVAGSTQRIHVLRNDGGELREATAFQPAASYSVFGGITAGDFNGDRREDFALVSFGVELFISRGDGTFLRTTLATTLFRDATSTDLDGDGRDDLLAVRGEGNSGELLIFAGDPEKGVAAPRSVTLSRGPDKVVTGDFDGDGRRDILVTQASRVLADMILRAGTATPQTRANIFLDSAGTISPHVADVNGDGLDDLLFHDSFFGLRMLLGAADASFVTGESYYVPRDGSGQVGPRDVDTADVDGDGDLDVAVVTEDGASVLINDGAGRLRSARFAAVPLAIGDFNKDGRDDIVDSTGVRLAQPGGSFERQSIDDAFSSYEWGAAADMNNDGHLDALLWGGSSSARRMEVRLGDGTGKVVLATPTFSFGSTLRDAVATDVNGDRNLDVIVVAGSFSATLRLGDGKGGFLAAKTLTGVADTVAAGDLDADGDIDLAAGDRSVFFNDGNGAFTEVAIESAYWDFVEIADMNRDGRPDLIGVAGTLGNTAVTVYLNDGKRGFVAAGSVVTQLATNGMQVRDFNRDGALDVLLSEGGTSAATGWMALFRGDGNGGLTPPARMRSIAENPILAGDFDGDALLDILDTGFVRFGQCGLPRRRAARH